MYWLTYWAPEAVGSVLHSVLCLFLGQCHNFSKNIYLVTLHIWLCQVLVEAHGTFWFQLVACQHVRAAQDRTQAPVLRARSLSHWTTREVPVIFFIIITITLQGFLSSSDSTESAMQETWVQSLGWEDPLEEGMAIHSRILVWESHGQRSLEAHSLRGHKESDMTE